MLQLAKELFMFTVGCIACVALHIFIHGDECSVLADMFMLLK
jgi:hypothetical protein